MLIRQFDKVTTDIFVPVIANDVAFASLDKTHFSDHVKVKLTNKGTSRVLQKLLKCFKVIVISTSFVPLLAILPVISCLNLNKAMLVVAWT